MQRHAHLPALARRSIPLAVLWLAASGTGAQTFEDFNRRMEERRAVLQRLHDCNVTEVTTPELTPPAVLEMQNRQRGQERIVRSQWTGGCVDGKLDGRGTLEQQTFGPPGTPQARQPRVQRESGLMVRGRRVGPWRQDAAPLPHAVGTYVWMDAAVPGHYVEGPDGSLRLAELRHDGMKVVETSVPIAAAEVARLVERARLAALGTPGIAARTPHRSALLSDLLRRGEIFAAPSRALGNTKSATVALVLSTNTLQSLQAIDALAAAARTWAAGRPEPALRTAANNFAQALDKRTVTADLTGLLREHFAKVEFAEDIAAVDRGKVDYILIFDFAFRHGGQALFDEMLRDAGSRVRPDDLLAFNKRESPHDIRAASSFFLLNRDLEVVRANEQSPSPLGAIRATPYLGTASSVDPAHVVQSASSHLEILTTMVRQRLGADRYIYIGTQRFDNTGALTFYLRVDLATN